MARLARLGMVGLLVLLAATGCSRRMPVDEFNGMQKFLITFRDGSQIEGSIGLDDRVTVTSEGGVYHGQIMDITTDEIYVTDCRLIRLTESRGAEVERMASAQHEIGDPLQEFTFPREEIERVERIELDPLRTATHAVFWTVSGVVSMFLLSDRS